MYGRVQTWWNQRRRRRSRRDDCCDVADLSCDLIDCLSLAMLGHIALSAARICCGAFRSSAVDPHTDPHGAARLASRLVRSYQMNVSAKRDRPVCNLTPSCSRYGLRVLADEGLLRGLRLIRARTRECGRLGRLTISR